jgi:hypothetical protein
VGLHVAAEEDVDTDLHCTTSSHHSEEHERNVMRIRILGLTVVGFMITGGTAAAQDAPPTITTTTTVTSPVVTVTPSAPEATVVVAPAEGRMSSDAVVTSERASPINRPLLLTSFLLFGGTFGASAIDAATSGRDADKNNLYYPVVGPWMDYAKRCDGANPCNGNETGYKALLILDGVGQGLGAIGMVTSLFVPERSTRHWLIIGGADFYAAPTAVGTGYGVGAAGAF